MSKTEDGDKTTKEGKDYSRLKWSLLVLYAKFGFYAKAQGIHNSQWKSEHYPHTLGEVSQIKFILQNRQLVQNR
jgi:hypothetical protein